MVQPQLYDALPLILVSLEFVLMALRSQTDIWLFRMEYHYCLLFFISIENVVKYTRIHDHNHV